MQIDQLISHGADILKPVMLRQGEKVAVGTAMDYGYFKFFQDRKIAHCPFHTLMPAERETFVARKRLLEYMGLQLRQAVFAKESQWDPTWLYLCKRAELTPSHRTKKKGPSLPKGLDVKEREHGMASSRQPCSQAMGFSQDEVQGRRAHGAALGCP
ncbi:ankyrin repeat and MYND domain-containing protein 1-like [Aotus nancymaae]|uniref:ankyrin repeat and MYND domain-containing protein 1-like n=1 Tax=Aotus nancymaae TaxID=37293 RepID=UPI0030FE36D9